MKSFSYTELDKLAGEVLPERAVLSTLLVGGGENENVNLNHGGGDGGTTAVVNACQSQQTRPDSGLLQLVGLHAQNDASSMTCLPGTAISGH
ncbi:hypothetical protein [Actinomadura mexicana]|uniref:Uncharacterized protein n=1 Tax=Actinomadura mexicana TaxID=134959 RepID=A0A239BFK3_9ACTN|nr:hypothetical protein [Actinomadura mexicana]SNS06499.1 hypothetical protein SAMN06265355_110171 [Actinomadura mexicana]